MNSRCVTTKYSCGGRNTDDWYRGEPNFPSYLLKFFPSGCAFISSVICSFFTHTEGWITRNLVWISTTMLIEKGTDEKRVLLRTQMHYSFELWDLSAYEWSQKATESNMDGFRCWFIIIGVYCRWRSCFSSPFWSPKGLAFDNWRGWYVKMMKLIEQRRPETVDFVCRCQLACWFDIF